MKLVRFNDIISHGLLRMSYFSQQEVATEAPLADSGIVQYEACKIQ